MIKHNYNPLFEAWWKISPMRGNKLDAEVEWLKKDITEDDMNFMVDAIRWQMEENSKEHPDDGWKYFVHLYRWIRDNWYDKEKPGKFDDCACGKANDGTHKYSMVDGRKVYRCDNCRIQ